MEIKDLFLTFAGAVTGGIAAATIHYRDETRGEPSAWEKMKEAERKLYEDGEQQAVLLEKVKTDAKLAASRN